MYIVKWRMSCLYASKVKLPVVFEKCMPQKLNFQLYLKKETETLHLRLTWPVTWSRALESTLPFKIPFRNSWDTTQLSKMLCDYNPLTVQQFRHNIVSPKFPAALFFLNLLEAPSLFGEYLIFSYDFKNIESIWLLYSIQMQRQEIL